MSSDGPKVFLAQGPSPWRRVVLGILCALVLAFAGGAVALYEIWIHCAELVEPFVPAQSVPPPEPAPSVTEIAAPTQPSPAPVVPPPVPHDDALRLIDSHRLLHLPLVDSLDDASDAKHAVTVHGAVSKTAQGARFAGDGWLEVEHIPLDNRPFAIALWIRPQVKVMNMGVLQQRDKDKAGCHLHLMLRGPDFPRLGFYVNDLQAETPVTMEMGWSHLVFQYTGWQQEIWLNGKLVGSRQCVAYKGESGLTCIGQAPDWGANVPAQHFRGTMRDVRIYDLALSAAQIQTLSNTAAPAKTNAPAPAEKNALGEDVF